MFVCLFALPIFALGLALVATARARWKRGGLSLLAATPPTGVALLAPASVYSSELAWLSPWAWVAPLLAAILVFATSRAAFAQASAERLDEDRRADLESCGMSFLGAGLLDLALVAVLLLTWLAVWPST